MTDRGEQKERATRNSWRKLKPLPESVTTISLERKFNEAEFETICYGLIPEAMEHKWFVFFEEPYLYLHRGWLGQCIYRVEFVRENDLFVVSQVVVNRDVSQYKVSDDSYDQALLLFLIENLLLGNQVPFPVPADLQNGFSDGALQHNIAGTGYKEVKF